MSERVAPAACLTDASAPTNADERGESLGRLKAFFLRDLSEVERLLLILWYVEHMSPAEIGAALAITETRVASIHEEVVGRMAHAA